MRPNVPSWFESILDTIEFGPIGDAMKATVEDSPWHREESVWVHTMMCIDQYMSHFFDKRNDEQNKIALLALLAHDFGKPSAEETLEKKDGSGVYRRYAGHEQNSAVAFTEFWLSDPLIRQVLTADEARQVRFIIEHHLPYGLKDTKKRSDLRTAMEHTLRDNVETFYDCLRSDSAGRISDDHATKLQNVEDWVSDFQAAPLTVNEYTTGMGKCYILIGPSGSGKTTWVAHNMAVSAKVISLDAYRLAYFYKQNAREIDEDGLYETMLKADYADAFDYCMKNEAGFNMFAAEKMRDVYADAKKSHANIFVDNTNGSKKARARYIQEARKIGMKVVAVEFWNALETLANRQKIRDDKEVPYGALKQQYFAQTCALKGSEVDEVILVTNIRQLPNH